MTLLTKLTLAAALLANGFFMCFGIREESMDLREADFGPTPCTCTADDKPKQYAGGDRPYEATIRFPTNKVKCQLNYILDQMNTAVVPNAREVDEDSKGTLCECVWKPFVLDPKHPRKDEEVSWFEFRRMPRETCAGTMKRSSCISMFEFWMKKYHTLVNEPITGKKMHVTEGMQGQDTWSYKCDPGASAAQDATDYGIEFVPPRDMLSRLQRRIDDPTLDEAERKRLNKTKQSLQMDGTMELFSYMVEKDWENVEHDCATENCDKVAHLLKDASPTGGPVTRFKLKPCMSGDGTKGTKKTSLAEILKECRIPKLGVEMMPVVDQPEFADSYGKEMDKDSDPDLWEAAALALGDPTLGEFQLAECVYEGEVITDPVKIIEFCPPDASHVKRVITYKYDDDGAWGRERKLKGEDPRYAAILEKHPKVPADSTVFSFRTKNCIPRKGGPPCPSSRVLELCGEPELGKQIVPVKVDIFANENPDTVEGELEC